MPDSPTRHGVLAAGNFIVDHVKIIDRWPEQDTLATIVSQTSSNGGGPYNLLKDLAILDPNLPLAATCLIGDDPGGRWILDDCAAAGIDTSGITVVPNASTSYTDAMTVRSNGRRTFFHQRGANALLDIEHFDFSRTTARIFHLGYILLLDKLDAVYPDHSTGASRLLAMAREAGLITSVDCVSVAHPDFRTIARAALREADVFFVNEFEAGQILGSPVETNVRALRNAASELASLGQRATVVLHAPDGSVSAHPSGHVTTQGSVALPAKALAGATGAGDAFAAGYLYGIHQNLSESRKLQVATNAAAASLTHPSPSNGLLSASQCQTHAQKYGYRRLS